jgi:hypothetical protein
MVSLKESVEALEVDKHTEILVRLLSALPGWAEKNVQVMWRCQRLMLGLKWVLTLCLLWILKSPGTTKGHWSCLWFGRTLTFIFQEMCSALYSWWVSWMVLSYLIAWQLKLRVWLHWWTGVGERVSDIKTRAQAIKCLTAFCEAVGPGFVFDRVLISYC